jgi:hypothetical protein
VREFPGPARFWIVAPALTWARLVEATEAMGDIE